MDYKQKIKEYLNSDIDVLYKNMLLNLFPELAESEDEKIRKKIIAFIKKRNRSGCDYDYDKWITWLEKQVSPDMVADAYLRGCNDTEKKRLGKRGEQKLAEWHREDEQNLNACLGYIPDEFLRRWLMDAIHTKYDKPTEWSEEDEINYNYALAACIYYGEAKGYADTETHQKANNWLKSLKERVQPQAKQEWSEEDEGFLDSALWHIQNSITNGKIKAFVECPLSTWLKSLKNRYTWKPSDEQLKKLREE